MTSFVLDCLNPQTGEGKKFIYRTEDSALLDESGQPAVKQINAAQMVAAIVTSKDSPVSKATPKVLKIALGLSCNYECEYCSQRFVPHTAETNPGDVSTFLDQLDSWVVEPPEKIEFWGGEPFVYIKTLRPLAEALRQKYPNARFSVITNGSLLTLEINEWLDALGFQVGLSHDGPGQYVRGPDPLLIPEKKAAILDLYQRLAPQGRMSFNSMMNSKNVSRAAVQEFFANLTGNPDVQVGEGSFVDAYDAGGLANSLSPEEFAPYRNLAFHELRSGKSKNFGLVREKLTSFINSLRVGRPASAIGQKCGMDRPENIAVDLRGNVLTCQNVSAASVAPNGESHKIGNVADFTNIKLNTATHWSRRSECPNCPMIHICQGSCMFLEGDLWDASCDNAYSDAVPIFAAGIEFLTGFVPMKITGPQRADRHDLWVGKPKDKTKKVIPIAVAA